MKKNRKLFLMCALALLIVFLAGCGSVRSGIEQGVAKTKSSQEKKNKKIDYGKVEGSEYTNDYFGLQLTIPQGWQVASDETEKKIKDLGKKIMTDDKNKQALYDAESADSLQLLTVSQYPFGAPVKYNPNFIVVAEKVSAYPGIKKGSDYLNIVKKGIQESKITINFDKDIYTEKVGNVDFDVLEGTMVIQSLNVHQKYYTTIMNGYSLSFIMSYSEDGNQQLNQILSSITLDG